MTDLDGRFRIEAVEPGHYYAFATLEGYLDPLRSLDFTQLNGHVSDHDQELDAIKQWKDHLVDVAVHVHRTTDLSLQVERGAEIGGTVTYDDGSPAIGMHFQLFRKTEKKDWTDVGLRIFESWALAEMSDSHGRFSLSNLPAGEYRLCALMPIESENTAPRVCLGNTFRKKDAKTIKVQAGEIAGGADIVIPLSGLHTVSGSVTAFADGHAISRGTVRLLYVDDHEKARDFSLTSDNPGFSFSYVPEGEYILQVSDAKDAEEKDSDAGVEASQASRARIYADKELPVKVLGDIDDLHIQLVQTPPDKTQRQ
ncbi:MAG: carboxypeptidase-like regulatory domain-containing protein [Terracidiphilus sp.]